MCSMARRRISTLTKIEPQPVRGDSAIRDWTATTVLSLIGICTVVAFLPAFLLLEYQGDVTHPESAVVYEGLQFAQSGHLYKPLDVPPYTAIAYGPLLYSVVAAIERLSRLNFDQLLVACRVVVFACFVATVAVVYLLLRRLRFPHLTALLSSAIIVINPAFLGWNCSVRPDVPAILSSVLAIFLILEGKRGAPILAGLFVAGSFLLKPTYIAGAVAIGCWLLLQRRWNQFAQFFISALAVVVATLIVFALRGENVLEHILLMRHVGFSISDAIQAAGHEWLDFAGLVIPICLLGMAQQYRTWNLQNIHVLRPFGLDSISLYFVIAWGIGLLASVNSGSDSNYYLEGYVATSLALPFALSSLTKAFGGTGRLLLALILIAGMAITVPAHWFTRWPRKTSETSSLATLVRGKTVLSDNSYIAVQSRRPEMLDPYLNHAFERYGGWSPKPIWEKIEHHSYDFVVIGQQDERIVRWHGFTHFSDSILKRIEREYQLVCFTPNAAVFVPNSSTVSQSLLSALSNPGCVPAKPATQRLFSSIDRQ
ncbi:MAG: rane protein of unknown function [Candidatus Angelobacter sp.]|jgi:hypothetical protein|nr:rane protein of unknown function [Candidatus Angelobacter sp.]